MPDQEYAQGKVLIRAETNLPPCSIVVHPEFSSLIIFGTYKLEEESRKRHGTLEFWLRVTSDDDKESLIRVAELATPDSSILDAKLHPTDHNILLTAQSTGEIVIWRFAGLRAWAETVHAELLQHANNGETKNERKFDLPEHTKSADVITENEDRSVLVLSLCFAPVSPYNTLAATLTDGSIVVCVLTNSGIKVRHRLTGAHSLEAWTASFLNGSENVLFSGGDDAVLAAHDLRMASSSDSDNNESDNGYGDDIVAPVWSSQRIHSAGVTSIHSFIPTPDYQLWTGGYDDTLALVDLRITDPMLPIPPRGPTASINLGGGVWKLLPSPVAPESRMLVCCMYGGARIVDRLSTEEIASTTEPANIVASLTQGHESMVYGGAWLDEKTVVTCSFYDKAVQVWRW
ncbi:uncharacterized protein SAPINGB_P002081 [Magnusiomyces paraingens]|uniref:methylated diphthine methylhydrolase n=1 Tax=Magnusiomyces paraingens TaxID=2606893 RepID=A0A5E8BHQ2_9ASCO|nr:uncharacterized protein SAPINGB_P002081 [Saprochaete ingens]VVT49053.1 unnamed protein product [Saprochaete ingens]